MAKRDNYEFANHSHIPESLGPTVSGFFRSWDDPHSNDAYLNLFAPHGELLFGPAPAKGHTAIKALREGMVNPDTGPIVDLEHTLGKVFVLGGGSAEGGSAEGTHELLVNGSIWYQLKNGRKVDADFATYMKFVRQGDGRWLVEFYQVYLNSLELVTAINEMNEAGK